MCTDERKRKATENEMYEQVGKKTIESWCDFPSGFLLDPEGAGVPLGDTSASCPASAVLECSIFCSFSDHVHLSSSSTSFFISTGTNGSLEKKERGGPRILTSIGKPLRLLKELLIPGNQ